MYGFHFPAFWEIRYNKCSLTFYFVYFILKLVISNQDVTHNIYALWSMQSEKKQITYAIDVTHRLYLII